MAGAFALSLIIEVAQYLLNDGRTSDVNDLIANTLGAAAGAFVWHSVSRMTSRRLRALIDESLYVGIPHP